MSAGLLGAMIYILLIKMKGASLKEAAQPPCLDVRKGLKFVDMPAVKEEVSVDQVNLGLWGNKRGSLKFYHPVFVCFFWLLFCSSEQSQNVILWGKEHCMLLNVCCPHKADKFDSVDHQRRRKIGHFVVLSVTT